MPSGVYVRVKPVLEETKRKISEALTGRILSEETKKKLSKTHSGENHPRFGKHCSDETKKKISKSNTGKQRSDEQKKKLSEAHIGQISWNKGKKLPQMSGENHPMFGKHHSDEIKKKMMEFKIGKHLSSEHKNNIRKSLIGKKKEPFSEGHRIKLSMIKQGITNPEDWQGFITEKPYCDKWTLDTERRTRLFFGNKSVLSGKTIKENGKRLTCHHVYHDKEACCKDESCDVENYFIIGGERHLIKGRTDKFILLTNGENSMVEGDKLKWARYFEELINTRYGGISYYTKTEYKWIMQDPELNEFSQINGTYFPPGFDRNRGDEYMTGMIDFNEYINEYHNIKSPYKKMLYFASC